LQIESSNMFVLSSFLCDLGVKAKLCSFCYCLITWVKVFSILTDFRFFGKDPDSSRDLCKFDEFFFQGVKYAFLTKKWKILKGSWLFKSCWFLFQSPIHLWNVSIVVSIYTHPNPIAVSVRFTTLTGDIVWPTFNSKKKFSICPKKHIFTHVDRWRSNKQREKS
jgi:hypothetical protein